MPGRSLSSKRCGGSPGKIISRKSALLQASFAEVDAHAARAALEGGVLAVGGVLRHSSQSFEGQLRVARLRLDVRRRRLRRFHFSPYSSAPAALHFLRRARVAAESSNAWAFAAAMRAFL